MGNKRRRVKTTQDSFAENFKTSRRGCLDINCGPSSSTQRISDKWNTSDEEFVEVSSLFVLNYTLHSSNL